MVYTFLLLICHDLLKVYVLDIILWILSSDFLLKMCVLLLLFIYFITYLDLNPYGV